MNESAFSPQEMEKLLALAAGRLGTTPDALRTAFQKGGLRGISAALTPEDAAKAETLLADKEKAAALLQDPAIQRLLIQLLG